VKAQLESIFFRNDDKQFLIDAVGGGALSFGEVAGRAADLTSRFQSAGICRGDRVGIVMPNGVDLIVFYLACLFGGFAAVPVNGALAPKDRIFILSRARLKALITDALVQDYVSAPFTVYGTSFMAVLTEASRAEVKRCFDAISDDDLFSIHFTSGTTSVPKGVAHRVGALLSNAHSFNKAFGIGCNRSFVHIMPMDYMAGFLNTLLCALMAEATLIIAPQFSAGSALRFWDPIVRHGGDLIWMSPTMLATLVRIDRHTAGTMHCRGRDVKILCATAPLPLRVRMDFRAKYGVDAIETYGLSELLLITANDGLAGIKDGAVGCAIPDVCIEIRDLAGQVQPCNTDGFIFVTTPHTMAGYLDMDSGQPTPLASPWFDTGDVGYLDEDGYLFVTGRSKDLIIRGGFNISPRLIEETLLRHPHIANVAVVGLPHEFYGEEIVAAVILESGSQLESFEVELRILCREQLSAGATPDRYVSFVEFPVTQVGKVQKNKIREFIAQMLLS